MDCPGLMSDWSMYELEDISWEEFGSTNDDHIVPGCRGEHAHESIGHDDLRKKQQQEAEAAVTWEDDEPMTFEKADRISIGSCLSDGRTLLVGSSWSHDCTDVFPLPSHPQHISVVSTLATHGSRISDGTFTNHQIDTNDNISGRYVSIGNVGVGISNFSKMCQPSFADVSPEEKESQLLQQVKNNVILDYEWDDIGDFENVDKMFRNRRNAFAQGSIGSADELSWFSSSSQTNDGFEDTFNFGIHSSYPEFVSLTKSLKVNDSNMSFLVENDYLTEAHLYSSLDYCPNTNWLDADVEVSESMTGKEAKVPAVVQNSKRRTSEFKGPESDMDSSQMTLPRGPTNTTERRKSGLSETKNGFHVHCSDTMQSLQRINDLSSASSSFKSCSSPVNCHENICPTDFSDHSRSFDYNVKMNGLVIQQSSVKKSMACVESKVRSGISSPREVSVDITNHGQQATECFVRTSSRPRTMVEEDTNKISYKRLSHVPDIGKTCEDFLCQDLSSNQNMLQNKSFTSQDDALVEAGLGETGIRCPNFDADNLDVKENNMITVFSDDISLGSASFRKLQDVLDQLGIRTKLCIRDGLYRLARNAEMRHCVDSIKHNRAGRCNSSRSSRMENPKQSSEFIWETGTNLIDRYIAHLLFYRTSDPSSSPINYAMPHESHHGSIMF